MKVNMSVLNDISLVTPEEEPVLKQPVEQTETKDIKQVENDESVRPKKHSKLAPVLLVAGMLSGLGLFVWNMTGYVNNMRLDNQGTASNIVYEKQDLLNSVGNSEGSGAEENKASADTFSDRPSSEEKYSNSENNDVDSLRKELEDAKNEAALTKQELKNAEDMLDTALKKLDESSGNE